MHAIWYSPFSMTEMHDIDVKSFDIVEDLYIKTTQGMVIAAEVWRDTPANRELIEKIKAIRGEMLAYDRMMSGKIYQLLHSKER